MKMTQRVTIALILCLLLVLSVNCAETAISLPAATYQKACLAAEKPPTGDITLAGKIVLSTSQVNSSDQKLYIFSPLENSFSVLAKPMYGGLVISPDAKWLAYNPTEYDTGDGTNESFDMISLGGERHTLHYGKIRYDLFEWIDSREILLNSFQQDMLAIDTSTGRIVRIDTTSPALAFAGGGQVNPALDRMVYDRNTPQEFPRAVLWDLKNKKELWHLDIGDELLWHHLAQWSPDGQRFVIAGPSALYDPVLELFLVERDGQAKQLTHLQEAGLEQGMIDWPIWSPDGRYIAFWLEKSLAVLDISTGRVLDYCIQSNDPTSFSPHWSPDSRQIVFNGYTPPPGAGPVIIVDIQKNTAMEVAGPEYFVEGWMLDNP